MRLTRLLSLALAAALLAAAPAARAEEKIKLGTLAPNGSPWHNLIKEMGQKWAEASGGRVKLIIYPGGVVGNEGDMVKKMRIGQLQAAALSSVGLHDISPEPQAIGAPMLVDSYQTLDFVMERIGPQLEKALEAKGYVVLGWSEVGFAHFFSTRPRASLKDFATAKVFAWEGDPASAEAWRAAGFQPVVMSSTDVIPSLQTGLIDAVATAPVYAFSTRIFENAKYMLELPWACLNGATVVKREAWEKIPADLRPKLIEIAHQYGKRIDAEVRRMETEAIESMKRDGLKVVQPVDREAFQKAAVAANQIIRGRVVPEAIFDEVQKLADAAHHQSAKR
jgi:TRAP-type C4-dicarboxylate transport system substrate-binding protein